MHLVWAYRSGYGTEPDSGRHFAILAQLAELESGAELGAKWLLARAFKEGTGTLPDEASYFVWMERAAKDGDPEAMFSLAEAYRTGVGVERDEDQYFYWRRQMAEKGSPFARMELAQAYKAGVGTPQSNDEFFRNATAAIELAKKAISEDKDFTSEDLPQAIQLVAQAHRDGTGTVKSETQYFECLSIAVAAVNDAIQFEQEKEPSKVDEVKKSLASIVYEFALAYLEGSGTATDPRQAFKYMKQAAEAGDVKAMLQLADLLEAGTGTGKNHNRAFQWRKKAANLNDPDGMYETAIAYGTRKGTKEDASEFYRWARNAVRAGHNKAFIALGLAELHTEGLIAPQNISNILHLLDQLRHEVQRIKSKHALSEDQAPDGVAHFTTLETLHSMLPSAGTPSYSSTRGTSNFLRLYNLSYVNDPQEGQILLPGEGDEALSGLAFSMYVGSFTLRSDRLDLWRAYGLDGTGYCIVTPIQSFLQRVGASDQAFAGLAASEADSSDIALTLYKVVYENEKEIIDSTRACLNKHLTEIGKVTDKEADRIRRQVDLTIRAILSDVLYLYKHEEYRSEEEARMLAPFAISARAVCADERSPARLFVQTRPFLFSPGSKIIIGPKVPNKEAVRLELKHRLDRNGHSEVDVMVSKIQYLMKLGDIAV